MRIEYYTSLLEATLALSQSMCAGLLIHDRDGEQPFGATIGNEDAGAGSGQGQGAGHSGDAR